MEKIVLLIDDTLSQKDVLKGLVDKIRRNEGINVIGHFINPNNREFWNDDKDPTIDKLIEGITSKLTDSSVDLIIVDQFYSDIPFKGTDVIEKLRAIPKFKSSEVFLYSGNRKKIVRNILTDIDEDEKKVSALAKLINLKISQFLDKDFESEAIRNLKRVRLNNVLPAKLRNIEDGQIQVFSPRYQEVSMGQLADMIESNDPQAENILNEIFDLTLSHYIKLNEGLQ